MQVTLTGGIMELSIRLKKIASLVDRCNSIADIGTDHAYIPIYLVKNSICRHAIASDINKGPLEKAKQNVMMENLQNKIELRLGGGLSTIKPLEVQSAIIAGMGGNLIRDIIEDDIEVFKGLEYSIFQPVQNPEVLRKYIYIKGYEILDEELCKEDDKFYEIIKVRYAEKPINIEPFYYEISKTLIDKRHPLLKEYIYSKIERYYKIIRYIDESTENAQSRKNEILKNINRMKELII